MRRSVTNRARTVPQPPNAGLIGQPGGRLHLDTPALVLDLPAFKRNLDRMSQAVAGTGVTLRPHAKTHKSAAIARYQMNEGAAGICCAKLGEAEALAREGIGDILLTSPVVGRRAIRRLMSLSQRIPALAVVADDPDNIADLDSAAEANGEILRVLVDLDTGTHRTGALPGEAEALVRQIVASGHLNFAGLQAYGGHLQHLHDPALRAEHTGRQWQAVSALRDRLREEGIVCPVITGGGTGTYDLDIKSGVLTELQVGSYIFMDRDYHAIGGTASERLPFEPALFVYTRVVSRRQKVFVTTDGGVKAFATDGPLPRIHSGAPEGASYILQGDEHGGVILGGTDETASGGPRSDGDVLAMVAAIDALNDDPTIPAPARDIPLGSLIICVVPHCDPTVNLYDWIHCVDGDSLVDIYTVDARGCSQ